MSPDGASVYVGSGASALGDGCSSNNVLVISTATNTVQATIDIGTLPQRVAVSPDGSRLYVRAGAAVREVDTATNTILRSVGAGGNLQRMVISDDGTWLFVSDGTGNKIAEIEAPGMTLVTNIQPGDFPVGLALIGSPPSPEPCTPADLNEAIDDLEGTGTLNSGQANALSRKLEQAQEMAARGQTQAAAALLAALASQIDDLADAGVLTDDEAAELSECTEEIGSDMGD